MCEWVESAGGMFKSKWGYANESAGFDWDDEEADLVEVDAGDRFLFKSEVYPYVSESESDDDELEREWVDDEKWILLDPEYWEGGLKATGFLGCLTLNPYESNESFEDKNEAGRERVDVVDFLLL